MFVFIVLVAFVIACGFGALLKTRAYAFIGALGPAVALVSAPVVYRVLRHGETLRLGNLMPFPFEYCRFELNRDGAVFMIPLLLVGFMVALFGICLKKPEHAVMQPHFWFFLNIMYAGIMISLIAGSVILYVIGWEIMSWAVFFLICTYYKYKEVRDAGIVYFVTAHLMFLLILVAVFMFAREIAVYPSFIFLAVLAGFGSHAGLAPLHVWLPEAQLAAPAHVSALLAGVVCNMGIYMVWHFTGGEMRALELPPGWWGYCLLGVGAASALYGAAMALAQRNLKRLLAYSVIETSGVIFMGIGLGHLAVHHGYNDLRTLFFLGGAVHMINHAISKSLLFMSAGVIINQTEVSDINLLGGVWKRLPVAGCALVIGCAAAAGLPPLNGFIGEFLLFNGCVNALGTGHLGIQAAAVVMLAVLGIGSGLMIVCFARLAGMTVMGEPRCRAVKICVQSNMALRYPLLILMGMSLISGVAMPFFITVPAWLWKLSLCMLVLLGLTAAVFALRLLLPAAQRDAGRLRHYGPYAARPLPLLPRFRRSRRKSGDGIADGGEDVILEYVYRPFFRFLYGCCMKMRWFQAGRLSRCVLYIVLTLLLLLAWKL